MQLCVFQLRWKEALLQLDGRWYTVFLCYLSISHLLCKLFVCCCHQGACLALNHWFYIVTILAFGRMIYLKVTLASLEISTFTFILKWTYYIITIYTRKYYCTVRINCHESHILMRILSLLSHISFQQNSHCITMQLN
jgi:hypothetical protein